MPNIKEQIIENLREVYDPELPINIYDLGLIYEITVNEGENTHVLMTLTSPTCPTADYIKSMIEEAVQKVEGVGRVNVELTFDPPWSPARVSQEAKEELGLADVEDVATQRAFVEEEKVKEKLCFNCGASEHEKPIISCFYKNEETYICSKCVTKF